MSRRTPDEISRAFSALSMRLGDRDNKAAKARVKGLSDEDLEDLTSYVHRHAGRREWAVVSAEIRRRGLRKNPAESTSRIVYANPDLDTARAEEVFEMWHKKQPKQAGVMRLGVDGNDAMVCIGNANDIVYKSGKWEKGRKTNMYVHVFDSKPKVWMLQHIVEPGLKRNGAHGEKTVESLLRKTKNADGQFAVADLAAPVSLSVDGEDGPEEIAIHTGSRVYGAIDQRTVIIVDPHWKLIVIKGGEMHFDERGIVK
jgi:hypothetical protein